MIVSLNGAFSAGRNKPGALASPIRPKKYEDMLRIAVTLLAAGALASCSQGRVGGSPNLQVVSNAALPPPTSLDVADTDRPYLIGPLDKLSIDVFRVPELSSKEVQADASGRVSVPLVGSIDAAGKTPGELARIIEAGLRGKYVREPKVTVNVTETVSQVVAVDGEVREPGLYPVVGRMTLMRAVAAAKGNTDLAKLDEVMIFRTVNRQRMVALYNIKAIRRGVYDDPQVFANDMVVVGQSQARRIFKDALQLAPSLTYPLVAILAK